MPHHLTLITLALVVFACAKEAEKPVEVADTPKAITTPAQTPASLPPADEEEQVGDDENADRARRGLWQELGWAVIDAAYPSRSLEKSAKERDTFEIRAEKIDLEPRNVHVVERKNDTLVMVLVQRNDGRESNASALRIDLVAASRRNGKTTIIDHVKKIAVGQGGSMPDFRDYAMGSEHVPWSEWNLAGTGFTRLGRDIWAWMINDVRGAQGDNEASVSIFALIDRRIKYLGSYLGGDNSSGSGSDDWHIFTSHVIPVNDRSTTSSDLAIVWMHNDNDNDSTRGYIVGDTVQVKIDRATSATPFGDLV